MREHAPIARDFEGPCTLEMVLNQAFQQKFPVATFGKGFIVYSQTPPNELVYKRMCAACLTKRTIPAGTNLSLQVVEQESSHLKET